MDICNIYWPNKDIISMYKKQTLMLDTSSTDISNSQALRQSLTMDTAFEQ
jgi:hypothetical protein